MIDHDLKAISKEFVSYFGAEQQMMQAAIEFNKLSCALMQYSISKDVDDYATCRCQMGKTVIYLAQLEMIFGTDSEMTAILSMQIENMKTIMSHLK